MFNSNIILNSEAGPDRGFILWPCDEPEGFLNIAVYILTVLNVGLVMGKSPLNWIATLKQKGHYPMTVNLHGCKQNYRMARGK